MISTALAVLARVLLDRVFSYHHPYVTFYLAVLWSAWYGGLAPALTATVLGAVAAIYLFLPPLRFTAAGASDLLGLDFLLIGIGQRRRCDAGTASGPSSPAS